jgi:hypothetical protein
VHPLKDGNNGGGGGGRSKAVAGYDTYHRNERGIIQKQIAAKSKQSFMMN